MSRGKSKKKAITAEQLMDELARDPEYQARMNHMAEEHRRLVEKNILDAAPLIDDLAAAGFRINTVADLFNQRINYESAIPLLMRWLPKVSNVDVKQDVIRALTVPWAKPAAAPLWIEEFAGAEDPGGSGLRWTIANGLAVTADDAVFEEIVRLVRDPHNGQAREMLTLALGNMQSSPAVSVLMDLLNDDGVFGHAIIALGNLRAREARSAIERFLDHKKPWIRKEAKKALAKIDAPRGRK